ncbi:MAG: ATP phosphoribosyltransferase regulatory subunit [Alphaproteobacteria bacterium]
MSDWSLLPVGLQDLLPEETLLDEHIRQQLMAYFIRHGYAPVRPPLMEYEENLLAGSAKTLSQQSFRVMDPQTHRMMAIRPDTTVQVARIAATRLADAPRPLRLCYAGDVLRAMKSTTRPERQFPHFGCELLGSEETRADTEIILLAIGALRYLGVKSLTLDLCLPQLGLILAESYGLAAKDYQFYQEALNNKDRHSLSRLQGSLASIAVQLVDASGPLEEVLPLFQALPLPEKAEKDRIHVLETLKLIREIDPDMPITLELADWRGLEYKTGLGFTLFSADAAGELGRGGRYSVQDHDSGKYATHQANAPSSVQTEESSVGFSLYGDSLRQVVALPSSQPLVFVPHPVDWRLLESIQTKGYRTLAGLYWVSDVDGEARRMKCSHVVRNGQIYPLG